MLRFTGYYKKRRKLLESRGSMNSYNVLVVDDEKEIRDSIEIYLKTEGVMVIKACDGMEALQILKKQEIHLIILDIMMPNYGHERLL